MKKIFRAISESPGLDIRKNDSEDSEGLFIEENNFKDWECENVSEWITFLEFGEYEKEVIKVIEENEIDGYTLHELTFREVRKYFNKILELHDSKKLWVLIQSLHESKKFDRRWTTIFHKLVEVCRSLHGDGRTSFTKCVYLATKFSNQEAYHEKYFSFFVDYYEKVFKLGNEIRSARRSGKNHEKLRKKKDENALELLKKFCEMSGKVEAEAREMEYFFRIGKVVRKGDMRLPVTLVLSEPLQMDSNIQDWRKYFYHEMYIHNRTFHAKNLKFGLLCSGIRVGPWYLEWNSSGIVVPKCAHMGIRSLLCDRAMRTFYEFREKEFRKITHAICNVCVQWNTTKRIGRSLTKTEGNCQNFVEDILTALKIPFKSIIKENPAYIPVFSALRKQGRLNLVYNPSESIREKMHLEKEMYFETHRSLDLFTKRVAQSGYKEEYTSDFEILKAFDRVFWLRHIADTRNEKYAPLNDGNDRVDCPYGDPRETHAFV